MGRRELLLVVPAILGLVSLFLNAQTAGRRAPTVNLQSSATGCQFGGSYRINIEESDRLYTAVQDAASSVPFRDQQRFFMDLTVRLTPPDLLAIQCDGRRVSLASSRASRVTFVADGRTRRERSPTGNLVNSRISMTRSTLTFASTGRAEDNLNVTFRSMDGGNRLRVIRKIDAEQLVQPIIIQSVYDKLSGDVDWNLYEDRTLAEADDPIKDRPLATMPAGPNPAVGGASELRRALDEWVAATNQRDIQRQMVFYMPRLSAFYLTRNTPVSAVRAEKNRAFLTARTIDIRIAEPEIIFQDSGQTAVMRFRKQYRIVDPNRSRSGEVIQELRWRRTNGGWRIFSERDVRVIR